MTDIERQPEKETAYREHLDRSETVWNRWSSWYGLSESDFEPMRIDLIDRLALDDGASVLDIGCGPGVNFAVIREAIGEDGHLVAIDYSTEMIAQARDRIERHGWKNITVTHVDATTANLGGGYDAALATLSLSVMPDIERTVRNIHSALRSGGVLGVLDIRPFPNAPENMFNPLVRWFLHWYANWNPDEDVTTAVETVFGRYEPLETHLRGSVYSLKANRAEQ